MQQNFQTRWGVARVLRLEEVRGMEAWQTGFAGLAKDHRYYEIVDETLRADFDFHYLVLETATGRPTGILPFFFVAQDLVATAPGWLRAVTGLGRRRFSRLLRPRMLMVGCAAGEGHPGAQGIVGQESVIAAGADLFPHIARNHGASWIVWKDFPAPYRAVMRSVRGTRVASMPATRIDLRFDSFDHYLQCNLSHAARKDLRRKLKRAGQFTLEMSVVNSLADDSAEVHRLYSEVLTRSALQFERLPRQFFLQLGERMPDRARFFLWRHQGRLVACSICLVHHGILYDEYLGLDYNVALDWHLYFSTLRDLLTWAMREGLREYRSTPLGYAPKRQFGLNLAPLDLYVTNTSPLLNTALRVILPFIEPTRSEPVLRKFSNVDDL